MGMMRVDQYIKIVYQKEIAEMQQAFANSKGMFQQYLVPCQCSKQAKKNSESNILVFAWPGNSPDPNPLENLWTIVKRRLLELDVSTITKLVEAIISIS